MSDEQQNNKNVINNIFDVKKINKSLEEGDRGFLLTFPKPPERLAAQKNIYIYSFSIPDNGRLPAKPKVRVIFTPHKQNNTETATIISSNIANNINIGIAIKSVHKAETQTLVKLEIKDIDNKVLYVDYILVICSPVKVINLPGNILPLNLINSLGPNGGRILRISALEGDPIDQTTSGRTGDRFVDVAGQLFPNMVVTGPQIPTDKSFVISTFLNEQRTDIELLPYFDNITPRNFFNTTYTQIYSFFNVFSCSSEEDLKEISINQEFIVLQKENNWSYYFRQNVIAQFVPDTGISDWENIFILLNTKNFEALLKRNESSNIPFSVFIDATGRVINDSVCLKSI